MHLTILKYNYHKFDFEGIVVNSIERVYHNSVVEQWDARRYLCLLQYVTTA